MITIMIISGCFSIYKTDSKSLIQSDCESNEEISNLKRVSFLGWNAFYAIIIITTFVYFLYFCFKDVNIELIESFYRIGSTIIGGGHVVIPMLISEFNSKNNVIKEYDIFNAFAFVSIVPGPMFNIAGYIGTFINGIFSGIISTFFIFLPSTLFLCTTLGFISFINEHKKIQLFLKGIS